MRLSRRHLLGHSCVNVAPLLLDARGFRSTAFSGREARARLPGLTRVLLLAVEELDVGEPVRLLSVAAKPGVHVRAGGDAAAAFSLRLAEQVVAGIGGAVEAAHTVQGRLSTLFCQL